MTRHCIYTMYIVYIFDGGKTKKKVPVPVLTTVYMYISHTPPPPLPSCWSLGLCYCVISTEWGILLMKSPNIQSEEVKIVT